MQTETLDRLYLEWSQFTKAKTHKELYLETTLKNALHIHKTKGQEEAKSFLESVCADFEND